MGKIITVAAGDQDKSSWLYDLRPRQWVPQLVHTSDLLRRSVLTSALDAVVEVGDTALAFEDPGAPQLDVFRSEIVEETAPLGPRAPE
jgi:hypothetical protein